MSYDPNQPRDKNGQWTDEFPKSEYGLNEREHFQKYERETKAGNLTEAKKHYDAYKVLRTQYDKRLADERARWHGGDIGAALKIAASDQPPKKKKDIFNLTNVLGVITIADL